MSAIVPSTVKMPAEFLRIAKNESISTAKFYDFLCRSFAVDVTLVAEGQSIKAHKLILAASSTWFEEIFAKPVEDKHPVIFLKGVTFLELQQIIEFMYLGYVTIKKSEKNSFFNVLKLLKIIVEEPFEDPITQPLADVDVVAEPGSKRQHVAYEEHHYSWESTITPTLTQPRTQAEVLKSDGEEITIIESPESSPKQFLSPKRFLSPSGFFVPGMYTCMHCKQSFKTLNHRDLHMKVCSTNASVLEPNELPVQCPVCKKFFNNISYVKQHVLIAHNISI